jgi:hypothetical protein
MSGIPSTSVSGCRSHSILRLLNKQIAVHPDVAPAQAVKTLVHELGHALLHADEALRSRKTQEVEVESVAYIVCDALGLDSNDYSFRLVAVWTTATWRRSKRPGSES